MPWWQRWLLGRRPARDQDAVRVVRAFFARRGAAHLVLPDGWIGRPYDDYVSLASVTDDGADLTFAFVTGESLVVSTDVTAGEGETSPMMES